MSAFFGVFDLCEIDTADGTYRFMIGMDGTFTDANGTEWLGSSLASLSTLGTSIGGTAPSGSVTLSYFQDPEADSPIDQLKALGQAYVYGREIRFFVARFTSPEQALNRTVTPMQWATRIIRGVQFDFSGAQDRSITLAFESYAEVRQTARRIRMDQEGHETLLGAANPSLSLRPTNSFESEPLWG